jgi:hypothetical protein
MAFRLTWPGVSLVVDDGLVDVRVEHEGRWLVVHDAEAPAPVDGTIRTHGLWLSMVCETPGEHWSVVLESFGLAVDHPDDELGDLVPLGLDVEWEAPGHVHGDLLIGDEVLVVDSRGELSAD